MHKVLLVDDEELVIDSLKASVDWQAYGFEVIGTALNAEDALEAIRSLKPDLVFTDIRMPGTNGLEFIKQAKATECTSLFIIISGYAEFAFAQKAINIGAIGYCLKPFDEVEIAGYLRKAKANLNKPDIRSEIEILDWIEDDTAQGAEQLRLALAVAGLNVSSEANIRVLVSLGKSKLKLGAKPCTVITLRIGYQKYAYLVGGDTFRYDKTEGIMGIGISGSIESSSQIKDAIHEAEVNAYRYFTMGSDNTIPSEAWTLAPERDPLVRSLQESIARKDIPAIFSSLTQMESSFASGRLNMKHALLVYNEMVSLLNQFQEVEMEHLYAFGGLARLYGDARQMLQLLKRSLSENMNRRSLKVVPQEIKNRTFTTIVHHVNENFCQDLSIQTISQQFNVNPNYVSQLFKKEVGTSFTEYLNKLRMEYACQLLRTTDVPIQEIAEKVGYHDYFYFSRQFKKFTGKPPSVYRIVTDS